MEMGKRRQAVRLRLLGTTCRLVLFLNYALACHAQTADPRIHNLLSRMTLE